jgi:hypothetical protein
MKRFVLFLFSLLIGVSIYAQTVENIRVDQEGDNILVHYRIGGSTDVQTYNVTLSCSIDGGRRFEPKTVFGDVNENIRGGKSNYTITWDVFEDLEEVGEVEFFVKVDLVSDLSEAAPGKGDQTEKDPTGMHYFLAYTGSTLGPYGLSTGFAFNKWGAYLSFRFGADDPGYYYMDWRIYTVGILRQIVETGKYRLYAYAGTGAVNEYYEDYSTGLYSDNTYLMIDGGIINTFGRVSLTLGVEYTDWVHPVFGVGYMFPIKRKVK